MNQDLIPRTMIAMNQELLASNGFIIFCDGGLANRINCLIGGLVLAERLGRRPQVVWPRNNRCGASFGEVLAMDLPVHEQMLQSLQPHASQFQLWMHENDAAFAGPVIALRQLDAVGATALLAQADDRPILYVENSVISWLPDADVARAVRQLRFAPDLLSRARHLVREAVASRPPAYAGVHLRGTDFGQAPPTDIMLGLVQAKRDIRFFVCSDDLALEARFASEPNVFTHAKTETVRKLVDGPWRCAVADSDGLPYTSNIDRTAESVRQAVVDLLLLAGSTPVETSASTFLALAIRLKRSGWVAEQLWQTVAPPHTSQQEVMALLALMRPQQMVTDHKVRIGGDADGGYVMPSLAMKSTTVLSIGIGDQVSFDAELAERGAIVHQYDHTIPGQPMVHPNFRFHGLGWGPVDDGPLRCLHSMVEAMDWREAQHAILKFDTEGAEWDALAAASSEDLAKFDVIAGEFHYFHNLHQRPFHDHVKAVLEKLQRTHVPVHLHANNATGIRLVQGVPVPPLLEITWVRRGVVATAGACTDPIPGPLDRPNMADRPDLCLRPF